MIDYNNVLCNHCFDNARDTSKEFKKSSVNSKYSCKKEIKKKEEEATLRAFTQLKRAYYICRDLRHLANKYPKRSKTN